jgi:DEAD/DEAH box helicase domain-containing protein
MNTYYHSIFEDISQRSVDATLGVLGIRNPKLREHIEKQLTNELAQGNRILADPVFEAAFPWAEVSMTFNDLSQRGFLRTSFVNALDAEHQNIQYNTKALNLSEQALKRHWYPRTHQLKSWEILKETTPKSLIVTSGTGSGKTECFMIPILDKLVKQYEQDGTQLIGVQALFIYPLNALINSQKERILSWTYAYEDKIRFCLYNGETPTRLLMPTLNRLPLNEVHDRRSLWESPPPILITNPTMLEYMMIRSQDRPILQASKGQLKYIVLDEAHTYIGSQAAELALLIRRVLNGFGVEAENVRFIATSATIGNDPESENALKKYLADIAGIDENTIEVVGGNRTIPSLDRQAQNSLSLGELLQLDVHQSLDVFYQNDTLNKIRNYFIGLDGQQAKARKLTHITELLFPGHSADIEKQKETLQWIDLASNEHLKKDDIHFLPLRGHFFHKVLNGLWACADRNCACKQNTPLSTNWNYGKVYTQQRLNCECGAPVFELEFCNECNEPHLIAEKINENGAIRFSQVRRNNIDEFELNQEQPDDEDQQQVVHQSNKVLIHYYAIDGCNDSSIDNNGKVGANPNDYPIGIYYNEQNKTCFNCGSSGEDSMRGAYLGMPFYVSGLIPSLLDRVKDGNDQLNKPYRGRRLLTFTDSRQGTAKIAIKIQQESERIRARGLILRCLLQNVNQQRIEEANEELEDVLNDGRPMTPVKERRIVRLQNELLDLQNQTGTYNEELHYLINQPDISLHLRRTFLQLSSQIGNNVSEIGQILLAREFSRRPKRGNSLETLGLVACTYPQLSNITQAPVEFSNYGLGIEDWKDFLKICVDYHIRDGIYISITSEQQNWLGSKFPAKYLLAPRSNNQPDNRHKRWPSLNNPAGRRSSRIIMILARGLNIDLKNITIPEKDTVNSLIEQAWNSLVGVQLLRLVNDGFQMNLTDMSFSLMKKAWVCPVTNKFLDTTFRGYTPYLPINYQSGNYHCGQPLDLPVLPNITNANDDLHYRSLMKEWIQQDVTINNLKAQGLWTNLADKILEGGNFIRAVEHSAQIRPQSKLKTYEDEFKEGKINVLNCSTTMEMGVDIGGLSIVCNNNVPPHPSNYLQRAGRAGRRAESRALSLTLCKNNPHDQQVFQNPLWAFEAQMKKPKITLSSERIVRRHLQAFLFGSFLNSQLANLDGATITLRADWFFESDGLTPSMNDKFISWLESLLNDCPNSLQEGLDYIKRKSVLEGIALHEIVYPAKELLESVQAKWLDQLNYYQDELAAIPNINNATNPHYVRRIQADMANHRKTYLLSILINQGFLPGYGFPTHIVTFNNYTISDYKENAQNQEEDRDDNITVLAAKPTRNMAVALTEYAPGSQIVLDGRVFTSRGITLNFQNPNDHVINHQVIHKAWRCRACGTSGVSHYGNSNTCANPNCTNPQNIEFFEYLEPAGFATSFYGNVTNDISSQKFVAAQAPWVNTHSELKSLINPSIGSYIADEAGEIFYHNKGENGNGFVLCFKCGYTDSLNADGLIPNSFNYHDKLRGKNARDNQRSCDYTSNQLKSPISLGFADKTDVFELYLKHQNTGEYFSVSNQENKKLSWTLGVAFRHGLSKTLGINAEEIGVTVKQVMNQNLSNNPIYAICLYDTNSGGSGFASLAGQTDIFKSMLQYGRELLGCQNCQNACQNCLLQFDTKQYVDLLDRNLGLAYLTDHLINSLGLPDDEKILGTTSAFCQFDFFKEVKLGFRGKGEKIQLFVNGNTQNWDIAASSIRKNLSALVGPQGKFENLELWMETHSFQGLTQEQRLELYYLLAAETNIKLFCSQNLSLIQNGGIIAITSKNGIQTAYASKASETVLLDELWGDTRGSMLIKSNTSVFNSQGTEINKNALLPQAGANNIQISLTQELNKTSAEFGKAFWDLVSGKLIENGHQLNNFGNLVSMKYTDRFIHTPWTAMLLAQILNEIPFQKSGNLRIEISTEKSQNQDYYTQYRNLTKNWFVEENDSKSQLIKSLIKHGHVDVKLAENKRDLPHARVLNMEFENGPQIKLRLDQGVGYWKVNRYPTYPFGDSIDEQINWINANSTILETVNSQNHATYIDIVIE